MFNTTRREEIENINHVLYAFSATICHSVRNWHNSPLNSAKYRKKCPIWAYGKGFALNIVKTKLKKQISYEH